MLELRTLGALECRDSVGGHELHSLLAQPKRVALLVYLAVARPTGFHRRDTLLGLFWPDSTQGRARAALSQAVYTLRRLLGEDVIVTRGDEELAIAPEALWCDAIAFEEALAAGDRVRALEHYRGDLLKGFFLPECIEFEQWMHGERSRLRERAQQAARSLADEHQAGSNVMEAAHWARRAVALDPGDEPSVRRLMSLLSAAGDRAGALREHEALARRLSELELEVSPQTEELANRIRTGDALASTAAAISAVAGTAPSTAPASVAAASVASGSAAPGRDAHPERTGRRRASRRVAAAAIAVAAVAAAALWITRESEPPLFSERRVLVAEFTDETGDPSLAPLGRVIADWLAQGLGQTGLVEVVPAVTAMRSAQFMDIALEAPPAVINRALAEETGAGILISGSYYKDGANVILHARLTDGRTGQLLRGIEPVSGPAGEPMAVVENLRRRTIGALASVLDPRLNNWGSVASQPPSYEAYQLYAEGLDEFFRNDDEGYRNSATLFRNAAALDPAFTAPLIWATFAHMNMEEYEVADSTIRAVQASGATLAAWDRAVLVYQHSVIRGRGVEAYNAARRVVELAPQSEWRFILATAALQAHRPREAMTILRSVDPDRGWIRTWPAYWISLSTAEHFAGDFRAELSTLRQGSARHPDNWFLILFQLRALGALGRLDEGLAFADSIAAVTADPRGRIDLYLMLARELRVHRDSAAGARVAARGLERAPAGGPPRLRFISGLLMAEAGRWEDVYFITESLPMPGPEGTSIGLRGMAAARVGKRDEAQAAAEALSRMQPDTARFQSPISRGIPKLWAAGVYAHIGDRDKAMELLRAARSEGVLFTGRGIHGNVGLAPLERYRPFEAFVRPRD